MGAASVPVTIKPTLRDVMIQRRTLSGKFGGNPNSTFTNAASDDRYPHFMFPTHEHNPYLPQLPGTSGLFFECGVLQDGHDVKKIERMLTRIQNGLWQYIGQFELYPSDCLSLEEWQSQSKNVSLLLCARYDK